MSCLILSYVLLLGHLLGGCCSTFCTLISHCLFLNDLKTKQESLVFVKRMMAVAVSSITYLRGIFPEYAYRSRYLEGEKIIQAFRNIRNFI
uniref:HORMA domain-containing protein n=1 Tax=Kryptolebias marmoratus TaxID=37003 RepID=A0A3Q2ZTQ8_KRYMA